MYNCVGKSLPTFLLFLISQGRVLIAPPPMFDDMMLNQPALNSMLASVMRRSYRCLSLRSKLTRHTVQLFPVMNAISFFISFSFNVIVIPCVSFITLESRSGEHVGIGLRSAAPARDNLSGEKPYVPALGNPRAHLTNQLY